MKQDIENIIKKNLPEKKSERPIKDEGEDILYDYQFCKELGFNQAISQIDTSLIADEVLKVVVENLKNKIDEICPDFYPPEIDEILKLLSNLSLNKENEKLYDNR